NRAAASGPRGGSDGDAAPAATRARSPPEGRAAPGAPSIACCLRSRGERRAAASAASRRNGSPRSRRIPGGSATLRAPGRSLDEVAGRLPGARLANGRDGLDRALLVLEVRL